MSYNSRSSSKILTARSVLAWMRARRPPRAAPLKEPRVTRRVAGEGTCPSNRCSSDTIPLMRDTLHHSPRVDKGVGGKTTHPTLLEGLPQPPQRRLTRVITCPRCGVENPEQSRFCNACGASVDAESQPTREVRKTVTVLFCDVVGSPSLAERCGPEILRDLMARFYAAIREPVERHGGTVEKVIGDALVAVFGIPAVHEDDALRAVRAALEMRDAVAGMGEIRARIGVNTGDVLATGATQGDSLVVGDAVNVAARLEQAAAPGTVLVGEATWALVAHAAHGHQVEPLAAKGKSEPLAAWVLESVDPLAPGHRRRLDLPMVGRATELGLVRLTADRTAQLRRPHLVTMLGQPGIGK